MRANGAVNDYGRMICLDIELVQIVHLRFALLAFFPLRNLAHELRSVVAIEIVEGQRS
jgi:hypothetical protein